MSTMKPPTLDLFADAEPEQARRREQIGEQSFVLRGFALPWLERLLPALEAVLAAAPFRQMVTPGGFTMSVALSSCGALGWTTDRSGYRYTHHDPQTGQPWPDMPEIFLQLAQAAAQEAGFSEFLPDSCLINRYLPGAKMSLHQDKNECTYAAPIVGLMIEKYLNDTIAANRMPIVEKFNKMNLIPPRIYAEMKTLDSMLHRKDSAYLIAKGYIKLIKDTMDMDKSDEDELLDQIKKGKEDQKKNNKKEGTDNKLQINTEAILPNSEKKKPEPQDTLRME